MSSKMRKFYLVTIKRPNLRNGGTRVNLVMTKTLKDAYDYGKLWIDTHKVDEDSDTDYVLEFIKELEEQFKNNVKEPEIDGYTGYTDDDCFTFNIKKITLNPDDKYLCKIFFNC